MNPGCTPEQLQEAVDAFAEHGTKKGAAIALDLHPNTYANRLTRARELGYRAHDTTHYPVPPEHDLDGVSRLEDAEGNVRLRWVKSKRDKQRQLELMREIVNGMAEEAPRAQPIKTPSFKTNDDLLNLYIITDYHFGMLAWGEETGDDWDIQIAEQLFVDWFAHAIKAAPNAGRAVLSNIGDLAHYDGLDSVTPTSGHILDADTRFQRVVRVIIRVFRRVIEMLLKKYPEVHLIMAEGNHDIASSVWLRELFSAHYADEPRVTVELSPDPYYCVEHGKVSLFFHHGHKRKVSDIHQVFAGKFREVFGRTEYSYGHMGHLHHTDVKETPLMIVEQHPTLAGKDSHASRGGYLSQRSAPVITYHKDHGEVGRHTIRPEMVQ